MGKPRKVSEELATLAVDLYEKLGSGNLAAKKLGVSSPTLYKMLQTKGINVPNRTDPKPNRIKVKGELALKVISDYNDGMSWSQLENKYGFGQYSMREAIRRANVKIKDHGGQRRRIYKDEENEVIRLYTDEKFSQAQISAKIGIGQTVISRILKINGIHSTKLKRENHGSWKGGFSNNAGGYILILSNEYPTMQTRSGYVLEHRLVMARYLNRPLEKHETVHHIDGNKTNNEISNLQLRIGHHGNGVAYCCSECGSNKINPIKLN